MNREIKFRAWDNHEGKWLFGYELPNLGGFSLIGEVVLFGELAKFNLDYYKHIIFMQYSGMKDRYGKEIYEGDIILTPTELKCEIQFKDGGYKYKVTEHTYRPLSPSVAKSSEVIGNKFQNKEQLRYMQ